MSEHYNIVVIGSGPGGYIAALKAAEQGASVACIEKSHLGGTCLNWGCIPSKALLSSAEMLHHIQHADTWGLKVDGQVGHDWEAIQKHKDKVIRQLRGGVGSLFKGRNVTHIAGTAMFEGPGKLIVTGDKGQSTVTADRVIIATGTTPTRIPGWPDDPNLICTSDESVHWAALPKKLLIVGGGVIGCEFACMMQPFGVDVTIVEMLPGLLPGLDEQLGTTLQDAFEKRGIKVYTSVKVDDMDVVKGEAKAKLSNGKVIDADRVLVSIGRRPNAEALNLDHAGIATTDRGFIAVNDHMQTNVADHYCIGDANGRCLLAHAASAHGVCAANNALGHIDAFDAPIPSAVYTFPEIAAVGITEQQCKDQGLPYSVGMFPLGHLGKAMATHHTEGFVKTIRCRETDTILGVHMLGHNATECIAAAGTIMFTKAKMHDLAETVFAHPTISESIKESAEDSLSMGLHLPPRKLLTATV